MPRFERDLEMARLRVVEGMTLAEIGARTGVGLHALTLPRLAPQVHLAQSSMAGIVMKMAGSVPSSDVTPDDEDELHHNSLLDYRAMTAHLIGWSSAGYSAGDVR
jgi:hypothetical protein